MQYGLGAVVVMQSMLSGVDIVLRKLWDIYAIFICGTRPELSVME